MDKEWIGTISAIGGAVAGGGISFARDLVGAKRERTRANEQRAHEISERRFDVRRDAYVAFGTACHETITSIGDFELKHHGALPVDHGHDGDGAYPGLAKALDLVTIIGPDEAVQAANEASKKIREWAFSSHTTFDDAWEALDKFIRVTRRLLKFDPE